MSLKKSIQKMFVKWDINDAEKRIRKKEKFLKKFKKEKIKSRELRGKQIYLLERSISIDKTFLANEMNKLRQLMLM